MSKILAVAVGILVLGFIVNKPIRDYATQDVVEVTIVDAGQKVDTYKIFTDKEVFENVDNWSFLKFNSSDVQAKAMGLKGKTVKMKVIGWRFPFFSWYRNVVKIYE